VDGSFVIVGGIRSLPIGPYFVLLPFSRSRSPSLQLR